MGKEVVKVDRGCNSFRIVLPKRIVKLMRWHRVSHVMVERMNDNTITVQRFIDAEALEGHNIGCEVNSD